MIMEDDILIDNYLKGVLSKDEEQSFLARLESDIEFNKKFNLEKQLFEALDDRSWSFVANQTTETEAYKKVLEGDDLQNLKKTLSEVNLQLNSSPKNKNRNLFYYLAAASIVVLLGFQLFFNQGISHQDLYNDYIALDDLPSFVSRGGDENQLIKAQELFEDRKYEDALVIFKSQIDLAGRGGDLVIYKGISELELKKYNEAEETFNTLINSNLLDAEKGYWYKALLFLKQDRVEDLKQVLNKIISSNLYNKVKAETLLKELD